jgi:hypothetical protein
VGDLSTKQFFRVTRPDDEFVWLLRLQFAIGGASAPFRIIVCASDSQRYPDLVWFLVTDLSIDFRLAGA